MEASTGAKSSVVVASSLFSVSVTLDSSSLLAEAVSIADMLCAVLN
ncbi:hypothetical protein P4S73_29515 [Paraglaciecola sp. Hal342]